MDGGVCCLKYRGQDKSWEIGHGIYFPFWHPCASQVFKRETVSLFENMCRILDKDHKMSIPFHPQGNSRVHRMVKVVGNLIAFFCQTNREWDKSLLLLTLACWSTVHEVTGFTPSYVMTGREIAWPPLCWTHSKTLTESQLLNMSKSYSPIRDMFKEVRAQQKETVQALWSVHS